jgi:hypothetical protein
MNTTTQMHPQHTPTPWTFDEIPTSCGRAFRIGSREIIDNHEASKGKDVFALPAYAVIYDDCGHGETVNKANAAFIVHACNSHAQLLRHMAELAYRANVLANAKTRQERDAASLKVFCAIGNAKDEFPELRTLQDWRVA